MKLIKETVKKEWPEIDFTENVLLVLTVPAEFSDKDMAIMRECAFKAGLIDSKVSEKLQFTTERMFRIFNLFDTFVRAEFLIQGN